MELHRRDGEVSLVDAGANHVRDAVRKTSTTQPAAHTAYTASTRAKARSWLCRCGARMLRPSGTSRSSRSAAVTRDASVA